MNKVMAFTATGHGIHNVLISQCHICMAHDPLSNEQHPEFLEYRAIWDTGATGTVITKKVVDEIGLHPTGQRNIRHANGTAVVSTYLINLRLPHGVGFKLLEVTEGDLGDNVSVLIGMDIITQGDFAITNFNGRTAFSFRLPSISTIDFTTQVVK